MTRLEQFIAHFNDGRLEEALGEVTEDYAYTDPLAGEVCGRTAHLSSCAASWRRSPIGRSPSPAPGRMATPSSASTSGRELCLRSETARPRWTVNLRASRELRHICVQRKARKPRRSLRSCRDRRGVVSYPRHAERARRDVLYVIEERAPNRPLHDRGVGDQRQRGEHDALEERHPDGSRRRIGAGDGHAHQPSENSERQRPYQQLAIRVGHLALKRTR